MKEPWVCLNIFFKNTTYFLENEIILLNLPYKFEAIRNKDYSVVKTSRAAYVALFLFSTKVLKKVNRLTRQRECQKAKVSS